MSNTTRAHVGMFTRLEVEGYQRMRYELTPDAIDLGLDAALPAEPEVGAQMGGFGRGERTWPRTTSLIALGPRPAPRRPRGGRTARSPRTGGRTSRRSAGG